LKSNLPANQKGSDPRERQGGQTPVDVPADVREELDRAASRLGPFARRMYWLSSTGSTNDVAARLAELGADEGTVVVAEAQTSGRGRFGRVWFSPLAAGLYVSIVIKPTGDHPLSNAVNPAALLTLATGVAIAEGVRASTGLPTEIKWPNDILIGRRKLAGILAEAAAQAGILQHVILGFGVNLHQAAYPLELADRVTSIAAETSRPVDRALILTEILAAMAARYADLREGKFDAILGAWRLLAPSLASAWVEWDSPAGVTRGRAEDIDSQGALLVRVDGRVERLIAGEVRWI
jgi:BirA family transcriptional regulator, biotin operon repressor / biotin---[acetyl-CoA-carboxylase] ligase